MAVLLHARTLKPIQAIPSKRFRASLEGLFIGRSGVSTTHLMFIFRFQILDILKLSG
jgi:hypothetical protein